VKLTGHTELKTTGQPPVNEQLSWKPFACCLSKVKKLLIVTPPSLLARTENKNYTIPRKENKDVCTLHQEN